MPRQRLTRRQYDRLADVRNTASVIRRQEASLVDLVAKARRAGASWADVGDALGVHRSSAQQRYGREVDR